MVCPYCGSAGRQAKAGTHGGEQRYRCGACGHRYTPGSPGRGYSAEVRARAVLLRGQGLTIRQIAFELGVNHQSVANWLRRQESSEVPVGGEGPAPPSQALVTAAPWGRHRPTIGDVARAAQVSESSVSNYFNGKGRMAEATRQRIAAAAAALHFTPSALVQAIRRRRTGILGVLIFGVGQLDEPGSPSLDPALLRGIHDGAAAAANDLLLYTGWPQRDRGDLGIRFLDGQIDGLLWCSPEMTDPTLERMTSAGLPVVALLTRHVPSGVGYVNADNLGAMEMLVSHLAARGHRRIAYMGPRSLSNLVDRYEGYRQALALHGLGWDPALQVEGWGLACGSDDCARILDMWLTLPSPPTAILCWVDYLATQFADALQARGLRIPEDMALAGFDDTPIAGHVAGGLTSVRQPFRQMGQLAAEGLLAIVAGEPADDCRLTVPTELIVRASTGGPGESESA